MKKQKENDIMTEVDIISSIEFDLTEAIKDLFFIIKLMRVEIDEIKTRLH
jgi:hypothetical protein